MPNLRPKKKAVDYCDDDLRKSKRRKIDDSTVSSSPLKECILNNMNPVQVKVDMGPSVIIKKEQKQEKTDSDMDMSMGRGISTYEEKRLKNLHENAQFMAKLGIAEAKIEMLSSEESLRSSKPSSRGLGRGQKKKSPPLLRPKSLRLQRKDPLGTDLPPLPVLEEAEDIHERKPSGTLNMAEYLHFKVSTSSHEDFMKVAQRLTRASPTKVTKGFPDLNSYMKDFSKLNLTENRVAKVVPERIFSLAIHPTETKVLVATGDKWGALGLWDVHQSDNHPTHGVVAYEPHSRPISCMHFSPYIQSQLLTCSYDGTFRCCDLNKEVFEEIYSTPADDDMLLKYFDFLSPDTYLVSRQDGSVSLVDRRTKGCEAEEIYNLHYKSLRSISIHPLEKHLFSTASTDGTTCFWDHRKLVSKKFNKPLHTVAHGKSCHGAFFSPVTGNRFLTTSMDDTVTIYDTSNMSKGVPILSKIRHDNHTGRWLTPFKAVWHPRREDMFVVGSMARPRQIEIFSDEGILLKNFRSDHLSSVCSLNVIHPTRNIIAGGNSSGRLHVFM